MKENLGGVMAKCENGSDVIGFERTSEHSMSQAAPVL